MDITSAGAGGSGMPPASNSQQRGRLGEELAALYLTRHEYHLLDRNWRIGHLEVDLIADYYGEIVFVEVKTRSSETPHSAFDAVDHTKKVRLVRAARAYLNQRHIDAPCRFDIITVIGNAAPYELTHYIHAYEAEKVMRRQHRLSL